MYTNDLFPPFPFLLYTLETEDKTRGEVVYFLIGHPQNLHQGLLAVDLLSSIMFSLTCCHNFIIF